MPKGKVRTNQRTFGRGLRRRARSSSWWEVCRTARTVSALQGSKTLRTTQLIQPELLLARRRVPHREIYFVALSGQHGARFSLKFALRIRPKEAKLKPKALRACTVCRSA